MFKELVLYNLMNVRILFIKKSHNRIEVEELVG